jgi:hypothetical protein
MLRKFQALYGLLFMRARIVANAFDNVEIHYKEIWEVIHRRAVWWAFYASRAQELQRFAAFHVLSQGSSASTCERN